MMKLSRPLLFLYFSPCSWSLLACTAAVPSCLHSPRISNGDRPIKTYEDLIVGYAQLGAESEWRVANTISIKETAEQLGVELRFSRCTAKTG
jgi:galactofuranose transport system substrate-binding protein